uniref:methyl-CpG-binding domain-containing protein 2-like n=1 Tax=Erigeron canadensis TaxID=72917 RepID=UPI001CB8DE42|nr:methyl-CpG-binding domain-containing protein 2-like [Erigeron canadensis]XP_043627680.1 methyl-CpG-binding domain-containing protein 2-like [Erigeron canadensis]
MQSRSPKITIKMGGKSVHEGSSVPSHSDTIVKTEKVVGVTSSGQSSEDEEKDTPLCNDSQKQMVLYDPSQNGSQPHKSLQNRVANKLKGPSRKPPEVGAFTVQCANCLKWRLIPDQEKYEVIREHITNQPFLCETTREWNRDVSCDDPTDIEQDGSRIWAIDKPDIAKPPPGWKRLLRLRNEGSSKFADVYYTSPTGAKLRSLPDIDRYLQKYPEQAQGIGLARFSFQVPKPLQENYVRKRPAQMAAPVTPEYLEPSPVEPIAWAGPDENLDLHIVQPLSWAGPEENRNGMPPYVRTTEPGSVNQAAKKTKSSNIEYF